MKIGFLVNYGTTGKNVPRYRFTAIDTRAKKRTVVTGSLKEVTREYTERFPEYSTQVIVVPTVGRKSFWKKLGELFWYPL